MLVCTVQLKIYSGISKGLVILEGTKWHMSTFRYYDLNYTGIDYIIKKKLAQVISIRTRVLYLCFEHEAMEMN
jgi:hypothetical protein